MKPTARMLTVLLASLLAAAPLATHAANESKAEAPVKVLSLRGTAIQAPDAVTDNFKPERDRPPIPRDFIQQPPLIPHTIQGYAITKNFNKCLDCHSWARYKEMGATKVSLTHFKDREGTEHANISPRRYFCVQCHVPQADAKPLVENTYKPATAAR